MTLNRGLVPFNVISTMGGATGGAGGEGVGGGTTYPELLRPEPRRGYNENEKNEKNEKWFIAYSSSMLDCT